MAITPSNPYLNVFFEETNQVTRARQYFPGSVQTITITTANHVFTVGSLLSPSEVRSRSLVNIAVTNQQNTTITLDKNYHLVGDSISFAWTPTDITGATTVTIVDDAASPATLATITATSEGSRSRSSRSFTLNTDGTWISTGPVPTAGSQVSKYLVATATYDPASITSPNTTSTTITVTGAAVGDYVIPTLTTLSTAAQLTGYVSATDTVTVVVGAFSGTVNLASGTLNVLVIKAS